MSVHNFKQLIRLHSWWHSTDVPVRTFALVELRYDIADQYGHPVYTKAGLLEYGYDAPVMVTIDDLKDMIDTEALKPMNTIPNMPRPK